MNKGKGKNKKSYSSKKLFKTEKQAISYAYGTLVSNPGNNKKKKGQVVNPLVIKK